MKAVKSGLFVLEKNLFGILSLQGKLINAKDSTDARVKSNKWIQLIVKSLGLDFNKKYTTKSEQEELRYGKVLIMSDPDVNGIHLTGLIITLFHKYWPALLKRKNMFSKMKFPIVHVYSKSASKETFLFYSLKHFENWRQRTNNLNDFTINYFRGNFLK